MLKQQLQIKLSQKLSPQQIKLMKLIQLSTLDLEQKIESEIGENPALESGAESTRSENQDNEFEENTKIETDEIDIDQYLSDDEIPSYRLYSNNYSSDENERTVPLSGGISFHQSLLQQMGNLILNDDEMLIAEFLIGSIDDSCYLRRSDDELIDDLAFTQNIFTDKKILWGSDWPVCKLRTDYLGWFNTANNLTDELSLSEKQNIFYENAIKFYKLKI